MLTVVCILFVSILNRRETKNKNCRKTAGRRNKECQITYKNEENARDCPKKSILNHTLKIFTKIKGSEVIKNNTQSIFLALNSGL